MPDRNSRPPFESPYPIDDNMILKEPEIDAEVFVASGAVLLGDVRVGAHSSIWYNVVIRADMAPIQIGRYCNIQDGAVIHVDQEMPAILKDGVSVGHRAVIHAATIEKDCLIGMGAVVLNGAVVGEESVVGAAALVTEGMEIPPRSLVLGVPGRIVGEVDDALMERILITRNNYVNYGYRYRKLSMM